MAVEGLEKFEDMVVRAAETTAAHARAAKAAIGAVIFGQEQRGRPRADHDSVGRPCAAGRRAGPRQDQAGRDHGHGARARRAAHPVHAGPDAVRHSRHRGAGGDAGRQAQLPLHLRAGVRAAADGRRDQPRLARARSRRCCRRCRSITSRSRARATTCRRRSMCWRRRTRWSRKAPIRCPKRSSTAS